MWEIKERVGRREYGRFQMPNIEMSARNSSRKSFWRTIWSLSGASNKFPSKFRLPQRKVLI